MTAISDAILNVTCQPKPPAREGCGSPEVIQVTRGAEGRDLVPGHIKNLSHVFYQNFEKHTETLMINDYLNCKRVSLF